MGNGGAIAVAARFSRMTRLSAFRLIFISFYFLETPTELILIFFFFNPLIFLKINP